MASVTTAHHIARRRRERRIELLFVAVVAVFLGHYWFGARYGLPVPNLNMPEFRGTGGDAEGRFVTLISDIRVTFDDGDTTTLAPSRLFDDMPSSRFPRIMRLHFWPRAERTGDLGSSGISRFLIDDVLRHVTPGWITTVKRRLSWSPPDDRTRAWLRRRLERLYANRRIVQADVVWYRDTYVLRDGEMLRRRETADILEIRL